MAMKPLGKVAQVGKNSIIVKTTQLPKLRRKVYDEKSNFIGNVSDYFGQTKEPFIIVTTRHPPSKYLGTKVYY